MKKNICGTVTKSHYSRLVLNLHLKNTLGIFLQVCSNSLFYDFMRVNISICHDG